MRILFYLIFSNAIYTLLKNLTYHILCNLYKLNVIDANAFFVPDFILLLLLH